MTQNVTFPPLEEKQFGGTVIIKLYEMVHRRGLKGSGPLSLGRWVWTRYRGKNKMYLTIFVAYRPNPPRAGILGVYTQHSNC